MTMQILFNGANLVRPGAYSAIDASQFANVPLLGLGTIGLIGEADEGASGLQIFTDPDDVKTTYTSGDLVTAAAIAANPANDPIIQSGAQTIVCVKVNNGTQAQLVEGSHTFKSIQYGTRQNLITVQVASDSGSLRIVTITGFDPFGVEQTEVSPDLGIAGKFSIQYTGAGSAATMTITATTLTTVCTGAVGDNLNLSFANYPTLSALLAAIAVSGKYTVDALVTNTNAFASNMLDAVAAVDIETAPYSAFSYNYDVAEWINTNSQLITDTLTPGATGPVTPFGPLPLAGGARGTAANTDWVNGLIPMRNVHVNQLVPLCSADATSQQGTYTFASVAAAIVAHASLMCSTIGRNEVQAWIGYDATKTALITEANLQNTQDLCLNGQDSQFPDPVTATITMLPAWSTAVFLAGMRCGAPLGEPLTWKFLNTTGMQNDASWSQADTDDVSDLDLNGVIVVNNIQGQGFRIDKCITTYTRQDNDAYTEETVVQNWKLAAYQLRAALAQAFVGRGGTTDRVARVPAVVDSALRPLRVDGVLTDSVVNGATLNAWRNVVYSLSGDVLTVKVTITPTPGINFVLTTITLVPAQISGAAA